MVIFGILAFAINWFIAWSMIRGNPGAIPLAIMIAATTGVTFAFGIVLSFAMVRLGISSQFEAVNACLDVAIYFGLPAAAWASYAASIQNRMDDAPRRYLR